MALERKVPLLHKTGLHLRAAGCLAEAAGKFSSDVRLTVGGRTVNAKSVLEILTLGAGPGVELHLQAEGEDAEPALCALETLIRENFNENA